MYQYYVQIDVTKLHDDNLNTLNEINFTVHFYLKTVYNKCGYLNELNYYLFGVGGGGEKLALALNPTLITKTVQQKFILIK